MISLQEFEKKQEDEKIRTENILRGNPLLNKNEAGEFKVKRRSVARFFQIRILRWQTWCPYNLLFIFAAPSISQNRKFVPQTPK